MRIITIFVTISCFALIVQAVDEHRPKKKEKRQLDYSISHHYSGPHSYRLERRISNGQQHSPHYSQPQFYPRPYHKDSGLDQTDSNRLSADPIDRGGSGDTIYIPHKPLIKVVEKPVYIKEPEPIIEIIIKESNITLPAPPTEAPPPPPKKKKEEVQVFYVKYRKNPNGYGKESVIYDKPIPAISPAIPEEPEPAEEWKDSPPQTGYGASYSNEVTEPPKPSTTLRTIIKPDSEVYHSPGNNVKVTFGKEGFDYSKRSSKPEDFAAPPQQEDQFPRARQLSSFSDVYFKRPAPNYHHNHHHQASSSSNEYRSEVRPPQSYRPFNNFPPSSNQYNSRPPNREFNSRPSFFPQPKYPYQQPPYTKPSNQQPPQSSRQSFPNFSHSISHPPPTQYQSKVSFPSSSPRFPPQPQQQFSDVPPPSHRKPVPYTPFENIRPSQPSYSQPLPTHQSFNQPQPTQPTIHHQQAVPQLPHPGQNIQFRPETHFNNHQQIATQQPSFAEVNNQYKILQQQQQPQIKQNDQIQYQEHLNNLRTAQKVLPPGGELVHSLPRFEQHLIVDPTTGQLTPAQQQQQPQERVNKQVKSQNIQNPFVQHNSQATQQQVYINQRPIAPSTARTYAPTSSTSKPTTTTSEPEKPSTTTKDPKILEAQLPDEVPEDLRQQLLSSGILNNADISILDYDKVGDIPISALPPDQLANFYNAGGAQQLAAAGSEPVPQTAALTARKDTTSFAESDQEMSAEESEISEVAMKPSEASGVEMKVVKYNPETDKGQQLQEAYISDDAKRTDPVVLNDDSYNRYLPLKVNGTQFPIPDVPELKGKLISSVVVLAPISYDFSSNRKTREASSASSDDIEFIQNGPLKELLVNPSRENYKKFLDNEAKSSAAQQAVILLVAGNGANTNDKEIFMYDIASKTVSKLNGELSSAFVEAAEANSSGESAAETKLDAASSPTDSQKKE